LHNVERLTAAAELHGDGHHGTVVADIIRRRGGRLKPPLSLLAVVSQTAVYEMVPAEVW
jgi:hypothetical protein